MCWSVTGVLLTQSAQASHKQTSTYNHPLCLMSAQRELQPYGAERVAAAVQLSACLWHRFLLCLQVWPAMTSAFPRCRRRTGTWSTLCLKWQPRLWWESQVCKVSVEIPTTSSLPVITVSNLSPVSIPKHTERWKLCVLYLTSSGKLLCILMNVSLFCAVFHL